MFYCQRQLNLLSTKLSQPNEALKTAEAQLKEIRAEEAKSRVAELEAAEAQVKKTKREEETFRVAISNVVTQRFVARKKCTRVNQDVPGMTPQKSLSAVDYVTALHNIDTSSCPKKFRLVWLDYVQTWERMAQYPPIRKIEDIVQSAEAILNPSGLADVDQRADKRDTTEAWRQCVRVALEFDVDVHPDPPL